LEGCSLNIRLKLRPDDANLYPAIRHRLSVERDWSLD
jgi:hypothetical protein